VDPVDGTRRSYDRIAPRFLANTRDRSFGRSWVERFAARCVPGARVLDVGAGPGTDAPELVACGLRVVLADLSAGMLRVGRNDYRAPRVQCDMRALPVASGTLGGIWANACLLHLLRRDVGPTLAGFRRAPVPRGVLHVSLKRAHVDRPDGWERERYGAAPRWFTYWTEEDLDAELERAGFRVVEAALRESSRDRWLMRLAERSEAGLKRSTPARGRKP
jgi:SAM-dependent methyltransferase